MPRADQRSRAAAAVPPPPCRHRIAPTVSLPGGLRMIFTGQEVSHVDGPPAPEDRHPARHPRAPTLAGIRAGKDEVLDRALAYLATNR